MSTLCFEHALLAVISDCLLRLADCRRRLEGDPEVDGRAIGDAALHTAGVVGFRGQAGPVRRVRGGARVGRRGRGGLDEGIVVARAGHLAASKAATDFEALGGGYAEHGMGEHGFQFVEARLTEADGRVADDAGDGAADTVLPVAVVGDQLRHAGGGLGVRTPDREEGVDVWAGDLAEEVEVHGIRRGGGMCGCGGEEVFAAHGGDERDDLHAVGEGEVFLGDSSSRNSSNRLSRTASAPSAAGSDAVLLLVGVVRVAGPGEHVHGAAAVVFGPLVLIADHESYGGPESDAELGAGLDLDAVFLVAGGGEGALPRPPAGHLRLDVVFCDLHAWRAAVDNASYGAAVRLTVAGRLLAYGKNGMHNCNLRCDAEIFPKCRHG